LRYFGYLHRHEYVCVPGVEAGLCKEQAQPFITETKFKYDHYVDGCWPSTRNPLCHYYPELRQ